MLSLPNFSLAIILLLCIALSDPANAWSGGIPMMGARSFANREMRRSSPKVEGSSLGYQIGISEDTNVDMVMSAVSTALPVYPEAQQVQVPKKWELPRHSPSSDDTMKEKMLWDMEMTLGRVAMVAAVFLIFGELFTGQSMAEQVARFLV